MRPVRGMIVTIDIILMILSIVTFNFVPHQVNVAMKYAILAYLFVKYFWYLSGRKMLFALLVAYTLVLSASTIHNTESIAWTISAFMTGIQLIVIFLVSAAMCQTIGINTYIRHLLHVFFVLLLINDVLFLFVPYDFSNADESYLIGNKFLVSYYHCFFACLFYVTKFEKKAGWQAALLFIFCGLVSKKVSCSTGIIMAVVLIVMMLVPKKIRKFLKNPEVLIGTIAVENILIWGSAKIFENPLVQSIIVNVFKKSPNMTGRNKLYGVTLSLVKDKPLLGYGHNTDIYRELFGYGNAQNGLFHIIIQAGIIGAAFYFGSIIIGLRNKNKQDIPYGLYMYLFAMTVASAIEISLSLQFMMTVAILYGCNSECWRLRQTLDN